MNAGYGGSAPVPGGPERSLVLIPEAGEADPASRFRVYDLLPLLKENLPEFSIKVARSVFPDPRERLSWWREKYLLSGNLLRIFRALAAARPRDIIYVQRGIMERGLFEKAVYYLYLAFNRLGYKNMVFDLDDSVYLQAPNLVPGIISISRGVMAGSHHLFEYASRFNPGVYLVPTSVAIPEAPNDCGPRTPGRITLGWIGSPSNLKYLGVISGALRELGASHKVTLRIMCSQKPEMEFPGILTEFVPWSFAAEESFFRSIDIGVMPLADTEWERGKCGFKLLRYMSYGIPAVGSAVGENNHIIKDGETGFLAAGQKDWVGKLTLLAERERLRAEMGGKAREFVRKNYSTVVVSKKLAEHLRAVAAFRTGPG